MRRGRGREGEWTPKSHAALPSPFSDPSWEESVVRGTGTRARIRHTKIKSLWGGAMPCEIKSPRVHVAVHYFGVRLER